MPVVQQFCDLRERDQRHGVSLAAPPTMRNAYPVAESRSSPADLASELLGYSERRPHLRVIDLARREITVAPVQASRAEVAIDRGVPRDGWIAAHEDTQVWALRFPLAGGSGPPGAAFFPVSGWAGPSDGVGPGR